MTGTESVSAVSSVSYAGDDAAARLLKDVVASSAGMLTHDSDFASGSSRSRSAGPVGAIIDRAAFIELVDKALVRSRSERVAIVCAVVEGWDGSQASLSGQSERAFELITSRLRRILRDSDVLASVGQGAYAVLSVGSHDMASSIAERMNTALRGPLALPSGLVTLAPRIGVTLADFADQDSEAVLGRAEQATRWVGRGRDDGQLDEGQVDERAEVDTLVNEIFAAGLLVACSRHKTDPALTEQLGQAADLLDGTIARLAASNWAKLPAQRRPGLDSDSR